MPQSPSSSGTSTNPPPTHLPWHHLPRIFPTYLLPQQFAQRPQPKPPKVSLPPGTYGTAREGSGDQGTQAEKGREIIIKTLKDVETKCPLYELVQYKCDVDVDGVIRCLPVVRLFRKCPGVTVEVTELDQYKGYR